MSMKFYFLFVSAVFVLSVNVNAQQQKTKNVKTFSYNSLDSLSKLPNSQVKKVFSIKAEKIAGVLSHGVKTISFKDILSYAVKSKYISRTQEKNYGTGSNSSCVQCKNPFSFCVKDIPDSCKYFPVSNTGLLLQFKSLPNFSVTCSGK